MENTSQKNYRQAIARSHHPAHKNLNVHKGFGRFGEPSLTHGNNGWSNWARGHISPLDQKSPTGWLACLYGGVQTGDDWARINIPVDEMYLTEIEAAQWSYYMTNAETMGVNIVFWVHDPDDPDKRAEITQLANVAGLVKTAGWNSHILNLETVQFFFYGEGTTGTDLTAGTLYGLDDFQADVLFSTWTVYRITIEYGWEASGTFEEAFVADIKINGVTIPLEPDEGGSGRVITRRTTATSGALALTLAPKTPFKNLRVNLAISAAPTTGTQNFTADIDAGAGSGYDENLLTIDTVANAITDLEAAFNRDFPADDEIDFAFANTDSKTYGLTISAEVV